jgi:hypothetical protein
LGHAHFFAHRPYLCSCARCDDLGWRAAIPRWVDAGHSVVAKRFGALSWPAFAVLTFTGIWNAFALNISDQTPQYRTAFGIKMSCYLIAGFGAALHTLVPKVWAKALGGAAAALGSVGAVFFVIVMTKQ